MTAYECNGSWVYKADDVEVKKSAGGRTLLYCDRLQEEKNNFADCGFTRVKGAMARVTKDFARKKKVVIQKKERQFLRLMRTITSQKRAMRTCQRKDLNQGTKAHTTPHEKRILAGALRMECSFYSRKVQSRPRTSSRGPHAPRRLAPVRLLAWHPC